MVIRRSGSSGSHYFLWIGGSALVIVVAIIVAIWGGLFSPVEDDPISNLASGEEGRVLDEDEIGGELAEPVVASHPLETDGVVEAPPANIDVPGGGVLEDTIPNDNPV